VLNESRLYLSTISRARLGCSFWHPRPLGTVGLLVGVLRLCTKDPFHIGIDRAGLRPALQNQDAAFTV
jgi:hypothetical protein